MRRFCKLLLLGLSALAAADQYLDAARAAGDYLVRACREDGTFVYRVDVRDGSQADEYNWLRHAGTIYALCQLHARTGEASYREAATRAAACLRRQMETVRIGGHDFLVPVSRPATTGRQRPVVKTGGCALAAIAFVSLDASRYRGELRELGDYLGYVQDADGLVKSRYDLDEEQFSSWRSNYYPGETLLALALMRDHDPRPAMKAAQVGLLQALANQWAGRNAAPPGSEPFDHWGMLGMAATLPQLTPDELPETWSRVRLLHEALLYCTSELGLILPDGSFRTHPRGMTPTAIRLEGIQAVRDLCRKLGPQEAVKTTSWEAPISRALAFIMGCQISPAEAAEVPGDLDMTGAIRNSPDPQTAAGAFVQIDYCQHAISALLAASKE